MSIWIKRKLFLFHAEIVLAAFILLIIYWVYASQSEQSTKQVLTISGGLFGFIFFVHKQQAEEVRLFTDLFRHFNSRYSELNGRLNAIATSTNGIPVGSDDSDVLDEYFNLCAEEYFYFSRGYIDPEVWRSWRNGMKLFFGNERIRRKWSEESKSNSFYGFDPDKS